ncbi:hypothetical protein ERJ75_001668600 [Trypanosoma vivax]|uniref:Uncharacterized protein n=1 Tax=Trypanosoma vivax (strain Y486) TaxID=1055687 RepID=G0U8K3_TRYVY|nr:hypothetical protein TRVL_00485 [Trypanosoma vivax]KAH8604887.1 hypothetical protein ERJ75_001668600 [Trypanosoma vivax]CCC53929.1 conserved hypothetical protein [Trypanosoma vivax Y486]
MENIDVFTKDRRRVQEKRDSTNSLPVPRSVSEEVPTRDSAGITHDSDDARSNSMKLDHTQVKGRGRSASYATNGLRASSECSCSAYDVRDKSPRNSLKHQNRRESVAWSSDRFCRARSSRCSITSTLDVRTQLRFQSIISNARATPSRRSVTPSASPSHLTEEEWHTYQQMVEREERRQAALGRVAEMEKHGSNVLVLNELKKEKATLMRLVKREKERLNAIQEHRAQQFDRAEKARLRRLWLERQRQEKLKGIEKRRERRSQLRDPNVCQANGTRAL